MLYEVITGRDCDRLTQRNRRVTSTIAKSENLPQFIAHQPEYNLYDRKGYEDDLEKVCQDYELGVVTFFSLASGYLSGKYRNNDDLKQSKRGKGFIDRYMTARGAKILKALDEVAQQHSVSAASYNFV